MKGATTSWCSSLPLRADRATGCAWFQGRPSRIFSIRLASSLSSTPRPLVTRIKVAKVGFAMPRSSSLIRWKDIPRRSESSSCDRPAFVRSSSIALCCGDRGLVRRRGGKVQAAFPPGSSFVNRYNVKRWGRGQDAIPGAYLAAIVPLSMSNVLACNEAGRGDPGRRWGLGREGPSGRIRAWCCATGVRNQLDSRRGIALERLTRAMHPAFLALHQPFLWVDTTGMTWSLDAIFMPSPPSIYLRTGEVKTAALKAERLDGHGAARVASGTSAYLCVQLMQIIRRK